MARDNTKSLFGDDIPCDAPAGQVIRVAFDAGVDGVFDYVIPEQLGTVEPGMRVEVPFGRGNKPQKAFCIELVSKSQDKGARKFRLKSVKTIIDKKPLLNAELMALAKWISDYYFCPLGQVLAAMVPAAVKKGIGVKKEKYVYLTEAGETEKVSSKKQQAIIDILKQLSADEPDLAIIKNQLLDQADCTAAPLKTLSRKGIVQIVTKEVFRSLPVVPAAFTDSPKDVVLNDEQVVAVENLTRNIESAKFGVTLLHGVTDSGKTEVYIRSIEAAISQGKSAIVLLPEIALTTQTINRFSTRFERMAVMHSGLTAAQRNVQWQKIRAGSADIVIGARSAVFAPLKNLGLIVVDEEHEPSYKQDTLPRYHGRDVAIKRSQLSNAHCLLGSATPSLETLVNCRTKKHFELAELPNRVMDLPMPEIKLVDMTDVGFSKKGPVLISSELKEKLLAVTARKEQAILLLNRRGYSNFVYCPSCSHTLHCRNCDVTLTFHKRKGINSTETSLGQHRTEGFAICHYCLSKTLVPKQCPLCSKGMAMLGVGSQRLEEELAEKLPNLKVARLDSDAMAGASADKYYKLLRDFAEGKIDVLAGTQMLAKGLHFPNVTLVGIISADTSLALPDFRANERTFQLISQVAGRAGRSEKSGQVIVQTFLPGQPAIDFATKHDYEGFVEAELKHRIKCNLPPYWKMAIIGLRDAKFDRLEVACAAMRNRVDQAVHCLDAQDKIKIRGPIPATISRMHQFHRMQIIVQAENVTLMQHFFAAIRACGPIKPAVTVTYDIDPINLM